MCGKAKIEARYGSENSSLQRRWFPVRSRAWIQSKSNSTLCIEVVFVGGSVEGPTSAPSLPVHRQRTGIWDMGSISKVAGFLGIGSRRKTCSSENI